ncbi:MAG: type II toxin-antitoxin system RelE/ParE family toxin [Verrucomicrobiales bacterium]|nr:type II toxin-antitoxin system RelE/ParE family toxin [Verrucomicrobiales bacterium]
MAHKILPSAEQRLIEIWEYTCDKWGEQQADSYITGLFAELDKITDCQHLWKKVNHDELMDVFFVKYRHHFIFFRELPDTELGVISILHEQMDIPLRLIEDSENN